MRRFTMFCLSAAAFLGTATAARAQSAGYDYSKPIGYDYSKPIGWNGGRDDRTKAPSARDKERERRQKNRNDADRNLKDKQNKFDDHVKRMREDNDNRGMKPYVPGWIRYRDGRQLDPTYDRLQKEVEAARRAARTAKELYEAVK